MWTKKWTRHRFFRAYVFFVRGKRWIKKNDFNRARISDRYMSDIGDKRNRLRTCVRKVTYFYLRNSPRYTRKKKVPSMSLTFASTFASRSFFFFFFSKKKRSSSNKKPLWRWCSSDFHPRISDMSQYDRDRCILLCLSGNWNNFQR